MDKNTVFSLVNMEMEAFEQTLSLQKHGDVGFVKTPIIGTVANNFIKRNEILKQNTLIYFRTTINVNSRDINYQERWRWRVFELEVFIYLRIINVCYS